MSTDIDCLVINSNMFLKKEQPSWPAVKDKTPSQALD
jgi:hypothetical protein